MMKQLAMQDFDDRSGPGRWYVVSAEAQKERQALASLRSEGFASYLPMRAVDKKTAIHAAPLFPRYLFVKLDLEDKGWWKVFTAQGVAAVITSMSRHGRPLPVPTPRGTVLRIREKEQDGIIVLTSKAAKVKGSAPFKPGDRVRIVSGAFMGFDAIFEHGDASRVALLLSILGAENRLELSTGSVVGVDRQKRIGA